MAAASIAAVPLAGGSMHQSLCAAIVYFDELSPGGLSYFATTFAQVQAQQTDNVLMVCWLLFGTGVALLL